MTAKPKQRVKPTLPPPHVCPDCYWKREYKALTKNFNELRRQLIAVLAQLRKAQSKKRGSPIMPTEHAWLDVPDHDTTDKVIERFERMDKA